MTQRQRCTQADEDQLRRELQEAVGKPPRILGLSRRTRLRLWRRHHIDHAAIWLTEHGHDKVAVLLWRLFRMW